MNAFVELPRLARGFVLACLASSALLAVRAEAHTIGYFYAYIGVISVLKYQLLRVGAAP